MTGATPNSNTDGTGHDYLSTDHLADGLRGRSLRGAAATMTSQAIKFVLALTATAVLARVLTPSDFGLLAMVAAITGLINLFAHMGLAMATVQRERVTQQQVSTLFWVNSGLGLAMALLTAVCAPLIAWFYGEARLTSVALALSVCFLFSGLGIQHRALLRRQMRFATFAVVEITAIFLGMVVAFVLAWRGHGYWSLVWMHVSTGATMAAGLWLCCGWRPGRPVRGSGVRSMLAFGGNLTGANLLHYLTRNADKVLIGWYLGAHVLGLYAKAYQLLLLPIQQVNAPATTVAVSTLSRLQDQPQRYRAYYRRGIGLMVTAGMPMVSLLFVAAEDVVLAVLGPQWLGAVPIFRVLGPAAFVGTFNVATGWVYITTGRTRRQLHWVMFTSVLYMAGFVVGLRWGTIGVAASYSIMTCVLRLPGVVYCFRDTPLQLRDLADVIWRPAIASAIAGACLFGTCQVVFLDAGIVLRLLFDLIVFGFAYVLGWIVLPDGFAMLRDLARLVGELRKGGTGDS